MNVNGFRQHRFDGCQGVAHMQRWRGIGALAASRSRVSSQHGVEVVAHVGQTRPAERARAAPSSTPPSAEASATEPTPLRAEGARQRGEVDLGLFYSRLHPMRWRAPDFAASQRAPDDPRH